MKKFLLCLLIVAPAMIFAQDIQKTFEKTVIVDSEEYNTLKAAGQLGDVILVDNVTPVVNKYKKASTNGSSKPVSLKQGGGTSDACNPWIQPGDYEDPNYPLEFGEDYSTVPNNSDDGSNGPFNLPFQFCLYGESYDQVYINNNGNLSFGGSYGTFTPEGFPSANYIMIAPFWGDVNMAAEGGECYYTITETAMYVNWIEVGYYGSNDDLNNSFQVIITNGTDPIVPGGNNVSFAYLDMQWTTGTASGGTNGFGGSAAQVGANKGDGDAFILFGQFSVDSSAYDGPTGEEDGVHWLDYKYFVFDTCTDSENIAPIYEGGACTDLVVCQGGAVGLDFLAPEADQIVTITFEADEEFITVNAISNDDGTAEVTISVTDDTPPGFYEIIITATDDFEGDPQSTQIYYNLEVVEDDLPPVVITGPAGICEGSVAQLILENPDNYESVQWNTGSPADQIFVSEPGIYSVLATTEVCLKYGEVELVVFDNPEPIVDGDLLTCEGQQTSISLTENYPGIIWDFNPSLNTQTVQLGAGTHTVSVTSDDGCQGSLNISIGNYPTTELDNGEVCGNTYEVIGTNNIGGSWSFNGPGSVTQNTNPNNVNTEITVNQFGWYTMTFTDECNITEEISVLYIAEPAFSIDDTQLCIGDDPIIIPNGNDPELSSWTWSNGTTEPYILVDGTGVYDFTAVNGCGTSTGSAFLSILPCAVEIPNIFTPNNDGTFANDFNNDFFVIKSIEFFPTNNLKIYDRWGGLTYESDNYQNNWSPSADDVPEGTYYYLLNVDRISGEVDTYSGYVQILR